MSIEALLEAAKYVELTGQDEDDEGKGCKKDVANVSQKSGIDDEAVQQNTQSVTTIPQKLEAIKQQQEITCISPSDPGPGITSHPVAPHITASNVKEETPDPEIEVSPQEPLVSQLQTAGPSVPVEQKNAGVQSQKNVMRHPGYDVLWSYSAPPIIKPKTSVSTASSSPNSNPVALSSGTSDSKVDETNSEDGEEGKKSGVREVHNKLEKNRRAHLKDCFDALKSQIPTLQDRKVKISNSNILSGACRYIGALKRKEKELEHELDRLVRDKIQKQKMIQRLKLEKSKDLHLGMAWHQEGSVIGGDLVQDPSLCHMELEERGPDRDEEDRYSTSTASEAEEEERKSQESRTGVSSAVTTVASMTVTVTSSTAANSGCQTSQACSSDSMPSGSYRHPLKCHLLREHRAQLAREAAAAVTPEVMSGVTPFTPETSVTSRASSHLQMACAPNIVKPMNSVVTVVPNMPISPSARPTVSQLLGKHTVPIRQPVRKPSHSFQTVLQPTSIQIQRCQAPSQSFIRPSCEIAVRPSSTQPVVTIGVTQAIQSRPDLTSLGIKLSHGQLLPVVSQGLKLPNGQVVNNSCASLGQSLSIVSSPLPSPFLQATIPGVTTSLTQPLVSPIALTQPVKQVFLTHQNLTGYTTLPPSLFPPFVPTSQTVVSPLLTNINQTVRPQTTLIPNNIPRTHPPMPIKNSLVPRGPNECRVQMSSGAGGSLPLNSSMLGAHQITTLTSSSKLSKPRNPHHQHVSKSKSHKKHRVVSPSQSKTLITTSQIAQTLLTNGGMSKVKTVTAESNKSQSTVTQSLVTLS